MAFLRRLTAHCLPVACLALAGCRSAIVEATLTNATTEPIRLVELDYPSASFGVQSLAPGADFHYRFKILGSGPLKLTYTDPHGQPKTAEGPTLHEQQAGPLHIVIRSSGVAWESHLHEGS